MLELLKKMKALTAQGFASAEEKAEVKALFEKLSAEEKEALSDEAKSIDGLSEKKVNDDDNQAVKAIVASLDKSIDSKIVDVQKSLDDKVEKFFAKVESKIKGLGNSKNVLQNAFDNDKYKDWSKTVKAGKKADLVVEIKDFDFRQKASVAADMSVEGNVDATVALSELDSMVSRDPQRQPFIEQLVSVGSISKEYDSWIETTDESGDPLPVAELAEMSQKDYSFTERSSKVKKIGVYTKYSSEMAEDLPSLVSEIRNFLIADLRRVVDTQILSGDGADENLTGILQNAVAFAAGSLANAVDTPNNFDVIRAAVNQVIVGLHLPNYVVLHPTDVAAMELSKDANGQYVLPPFSTANGAIIAGVRVIQNTGITAGTFLVGDFSKSSVKYKRGLTVEMSNSDQDDFVKDRFTVKASVRLVHRVRQNDYAAYVTGSFATAKAALDSAS